MAPEDLARSDEAYSMPVPEGVEADDVEVRATDDGLDVTIPKAKAA